MLRRLFTSDFSGSAGVVRNSEKYRTNISSSPFGNSGPWCAAPKSVSVGDPGAPPLPVKS